MTLFATAFAEFIYKSTDAGATWAPQSVAGNWVAIASSSDGTRLIASESPGGLYTSSNGGSTWVLASPPAPSSAAWTSVASSSDGSRVFAAEITTGYFWAYPG
jgi:photosystem II stability/assembly factor-like uncharacterized protein